MWRSFRPLLPAVIALAALIVVHAALRWYLRSWYFMIVVPLAALALAVLLTPYLERGRRWGGLALLGVVSALLLAGFAYRGVNDWDRGLYFCPNDTLSGSAWLQRNLTDGERVGAFNAGLLGYFSHRPVVNLDGSVNQSIFAAIQERELLRYVQRERITYLVDSPYFLDSAFRLYWGDGIETITGQLQPVAEFAACPSYPWGTTVVYRVPPELVSR